MSDQDLEFQAAYGSAMFLAHIIEDLVALHIYECSYFHINGYAGLSRKQIRDMKHEKLIDELLVIYGDQDQNDGFATQLVTALHHLRIIRNHLVHAFIPQVGADFTKEEGIDQIIAMLKNITKWERRYLNVLQRAHEKVLKEAYSHCIDAVIERKDPPFDARVSRSKLQEHLNAMEPQSAK